MIQTFSKLKKDVLNNPNLKQLTPSDIKELQKVLLEMLIDFDQLCQINNLCYFLTGGSALGAERHKGFIPWDDDIDVIMPRSDYKRFTECVQHELSDKYWVQSMNTSKVCDLNFLKLRKIGTKYVEIFENEPDKAGICIDIYPLDDTHDSVIKHLLYGTINEGLFFIASCVRMSQKKTHLLQYVQNRELIKSIKLKSFIGNLFNNAKHPRAWYWWCEKYSSRINNPSSKYVAVSSGRGHYFGERYLRNEIFPTVRSEFEGHYFCVAKNNNYLLETLYGTDYMTPPDETSIERHTLIELKLDENERV